MAKAKRDLYQEVTDNIIQELEAGAAPWVKPWTANGCGAMPVNATTGKAYNGVNVLLLWSAAAKAGFGSARWLTFRQAKAAGGSVRKGEKSTTAVFYKTVERTVTDEAGRPQLDPETGEMQRRSFPVLRAFALFNVEQCEDLPSTVRGESQAEPTWSPVESAEHLVRQASPDLRHAGTGAYYAPGPDIIVMPPKGAFPDAGGYYATLLHELTHWTGHPSRLARDGVAHPGRFGSQGYAFEELVAELGAAFLCAQTGIRGNLRHPGYIESWLNVLRQDKRAIFRAASQARAATEWLLATSEVSKAA